ncbi:QacE family quaternary ammonium compound efflux SMR transporter [Lederbergia ruris]|uniref:QacE family quaternary ammonium compound efflux SMR transporter n=1 Tax=Lederbergia ruris TaxID=217495 RepID=A0ABQ4KEX7_9BACI|nr:multidrug efflux SMR transporter [Lederbergia ruris]GIN56021.1 QacE family quaternary ammonium compound efflux SMR transporter [Lederbergia ruris]
MAWIYLIIASFGEIFGVMSINLYLRHKSIGWLLAIIGTFGGGFIFLSMAMREIPLGTAYAVWTGLGAVGAVLIGILFFKESAGWKRILFLFCIITGAVGLKVLGG